VTGVARLVWSKPILKAGWSLRPPGSSGAKTVLWVDSKVSPFKQAQDYVVVGSRPVMGQQDRLPYGVVWQPHPLSGYGLPILWDVTRNGAFLERISRTQTGSSLRILKQPSFVSNTGSEDPLRLCFVRVDLLHFILDWRCGASVSLEGAVVLQSDGLEDPFTLVSAFRPWRANASSTRVSVHNLGRENL
jgi:hypothetical protein